MKRYGRYISLIGMAFLLIGCQAKGQQVPELLEPVEVKADTVAAAYGDIYDIHAYPAEIVPYVEEVYFQKDGLLLELHTMIGDTVEAGQLLATLENENLLEEVEDLKAQLAYTKRAGELENQQFELQIEIAECEAELIKNGGGNYQQLLLKENEKKGLETDQQQQKELRALEISNLERLIKEREAELGRLKLYAPISGQVVYISSMKLGEEIKGYETFVCIADESRLFVKSEYISEYQMGQAEEIYALIEGKEQEISYQPYDQESYYEMLLSDEAMHTQFLIEGEAEGLKSGQYATVLLKSEGKERALVLPINVLYEDRDSTYVYMLDGEKRVRREVAVGFKTDIEVEITDGLKEGDVVYVRE